MNHHDIWHILSSSCLLSATTLAGYTQLVLLLAGQTICRLASQWWEDVEGYFWLNGSKLPMLMSFPSALGCFLLLITCKQAITGPFVCLSICKWTAETIFVKVGEVAVPSISPWEKWKDLGLGTHTALGECKQAIKMLNICRRSSWAPVLILVLSWRRLTSLQEDQMSQNYLFISFIWQSKPWW